MIVLAIHAATIPVAVTSIPGPGTGVLRRLHKTGPVTGQNNNDSSYRRISVQIAVISCSFAQVYHKSARHSRIPSQSGTIRREHGRRLSPDQTPARCQRGVYGVIGRHEWRSKRRGESRGEWAPKTKPAPRAFRARGCPFPVAARNPPGVHGNAVPGHDAGPQSRPAMSLNRLPVFTGAVPCQPSSRPRFPSVPGDGARIAVSGCLSPRWPG